MVELKSTAVWFIADANVLIDYTQTDPGVLGLVTKHIGPVCIAAAVLDEVEQLDVASCEVMGLTIVEGTLTQLTEASQRGGPLSFEDKLCLVLARDHGWVCLSNDRALREACQAQSIPVIWGLEIMLRLITDGRINADVTISVAESIHAINPLYITRQVVNAFRRKVQLAKDTPKQVDSHVPDALSPCETRSTYPRLPMVTSL